MSFCRCSGGEELDAKEAGVSTITPAALPGDGYNGEYNEITQNLQKETVTRAQGKKEDRNLLSGFISNLSLTFSPRFRMSLSISSGLRLVSLCPYQYTKGLCAWLEMTTGADVALNPRGVAGEKVGMELFTAVTDNEPGTAQAPYDVPK
jgi:hypothetical protein